MPWNDSIHVFEINFTQPGLFSCRLFNTGYLFQPSVCNLESWERQAVTRLHGNI